MEQVNTHRMNIREAVSAMRHHGASDGLILDAYKSLSPEHIGDLEELTARGVSDEKLVETAINYEETYGRTAEVGA